MDTILIAAEAISIFVVVACTLTLGAYLKGLIK